MAMKQIFSATLIKKDGKLEYALDAKKQLYKEFVDSLDDGTKVEIFMDVSGNKGSKAQLAKIHAMLRQLANDIGDDFDSIKYEIKERSGLCIDHQCKSFGDCDRDELNSVIQVILQYGDFVGSNLR